MELSFFMGIIISTKTKTPMPPIQWVKLRQKRTPWGSSSGLASTDAPVVVKPETISKNAWK